MNQRETLLRSGQIHPIYSWDAVKKLRLSDASGV
jgi:hypothetical protein